MMRCDEVIRELAVADGRSGWDRAGRTPGRLPVLLGLGPASRPARSALGRDPPLRTLARSLGLRLGEHRPIAPIPHGERRIHRGHLPPVPQRDRPEGLHSSRFRSHARSQSSPHLADRSCGLDRSGSGGRDSGCDRIGLARAVVWPDQPEPRGCAAQYPGASSLALGDSGEFAREGRGGYRGGASAGDPRGRAGAPGDGQDPAGDGLRRGCR